MVGNAVREGLPVGVSDPGVGVATGVTVSVGSDVPYGVRVNPGVPIAAVLEKELDGV